MKNIEPGIFQLKDGRYRVKTSAKCPITHKLIREQTTVETLQEARHARQEFKDRIASRRPENEAPTITLACYAKQWWSAKAPRLKASTAMTYERALTHRILPELGHIPIQLLTRRDVLAWVTWAESQRQPPAAVRRIERQIARGRIDEVEAERQIAHIMATTDPTTLQPYGAPTVHKWWRVLVQLLKDAHADEYLASDIVARVTPPTSKAPPARERRTLSVDELGKLLEAVRLYSPQRYAEVAMLATTGMRPSELYALTWADIDYAAQTIHVTKAVWGGVVSTTKTGAAREVPLATQTAEALRVHRKELIRKNHPGIPSGLVFPSDAGTHREPSSLKKCLDMAREDAKITQRVSPQVLRRTFNTLLIAYNVDRIVIRATMGHSSEQMTERYAGVPMPMKLAAVGSLATSLATKSLTDNSQEISTP